jgi:hypothetical protein
MVASAHYLAGEPARAEAPLTRMMEARGATVSDRRTAAQALVAVFLKTRRPVEALHASFIQASTGTMETLSFVVAEAPRPQWCVECGVQDLPYLLDAGLTKAELFSYLAKYPDPVGEPIEVSGARMMSAPDIVRYSLAVREARDGRYVEAGRIYRRLGAAARAARMEKLAALSARADDAARPAAERLQSRFDRAAFLADNPERILFNDLLWDRFQTSALVPASGEDDPEDYRVSGMTAGERHAVAEADRRLRDAQEERWQAFLQLAWISTDESLPKTTRSRSGHCTS